MVSDYLENKETISEDKRNVDIQKVHVWSICWPELC